MVAAVGVQASQARTLVVELASTSLQLSQARTLAIYNFPTASIEASQAKTLTVGKYGGTEVQVSQARTLAVVRGRTENRTLRMWTFSLDGHDFVVIRLGEISTVVYDMLTQKWFDWDSEDLDFWRANCGMNWIGMGKTTFDQFLGTDIVAGDDAHGLLWILDPDQGYDDHPLDTYPDGIAINRVVTGQVPVRMRDTIDCGGVYLTFATGQPALTAAYFKLETSDDQANTWVDHGTVTVNPDDWPQQVQWLSLGQIVSPGRIFRITDNGATVRIDGLDMLDPT